MQITVDTNILVRFLTHDDPVQLDAVKKILDEADKICIPTHVFCEVVWVLFRMYGYCKKDVATAIRTLTEVNKLIYAEDEVAAGLEQLEMGGDFADGVNEYTGRVLGSYQFVTFDKKAAVLMKKRGCNVKLL